MLKGYEGSCILKLMIIHPLFDCVLINIAEQYTPVFFKLFCSYPTYCNHFQSGGVGSGASNVITYKVNVSFFKD